MKQPNKWSCFPAAISMAAGVSFDNLIEAIGHDGSEIIAPDLPEPVRRKGFHFQEISKALLTFNKFAIYFEDTMYSKRKNQLIKESFDLFDLMKQYDGVIGGYFHSHYPHAVAWDHKKKLIYDPNGTVYPLDFKIIVTGFTVVR